MVNGVHAAGDGCLCALGVGNKTKTEKQCENQPNTGFIIFPSLRIITSF